MKSIYELLINTPAKNTKRLKLAFKAIAAGDWSQAITDLEMFQKNEYFGVQHKDIESLIEHCKKSNNN